MSTADPSDRSDGSPPSASERASFVGRVIGTEDSTPLDFWVALAPDRSLQLDDVVALERTAPGRKTVRIFGVVTQIRARHEGARFDSDVFLIEDGVLPAEVTEAAHILATRFEPEVFIPPLPGQAVRRAEGDERDEALFFDGMERKVAAGLSREDEPVYIDLEFVDGTRGAHVNISGVSGVARLTLPPLGMTVDIVDEHRLETGSPCVYVVNHQNAFDVPIAARLYPLNTVIIAKKELGQIPFFGWLFVRTGNLLIDRKSNPAAVHRLRVAETAIRERGVSVLIFPEGTRGGGTGELLPFKKGAFYMAVSAQVPIVPIVVSPMKTNFDIGERRIRPGRVRIRVLEEVPTRGMTEQDVPRLLENVRAKMAAALSAAITHAVAAMTNT